MKQISDKVNLSLRRCKNKGNKITTAEARNSTYLETLVKLVGGYYILRLGTHLLIWKQEKKTFLQ